MRRSRSGHAPRKAWAVALVFSAVLVRADDPPNFGKTLNLVYEKPDWKRIPDPFLPGGPRPYPPQADYSQEKVRDTSTVVVLIAALSETRLVTTLRTLFEKAKRPERVFAGVVQQNNANDMDALEGLCRELGTPLELKPEFRGRSNLHRRQPEEDAWGRGRFTEESMAGCEYSNRVRILRMDSIEARGPAYARARQPLLLSVGDLMEDFCMQIDAHTVFIQDWDDKILQEWSATNNEYAVLTTYPTGADNLKEDWTVVNVNNHYEMPLLCDAEYFGGPLVRNSQAGAVANLDKPCLSKLWGAGLSYSRCHAERDVPNDPNMQGIFMGEEFSRAARLWTNGYDMYAPARPYLVTYYGGDKGGRGSFSGGTQAEAKYALARQATLVQNKNSDQSPEARERLKGFDLGERRSYTDYIALTGVDTINGRYTHTPCAVPRWTPWRSGSQPPYKMLEKSPVKLGVDIGSLLRGKESDAFFLTPPTKGAARPQLRGAASVPEAEAEKDDDDDDGGGSPEAMEARSQAERDLVEEDDEGGASDEGSAGEQAPSPKDANEAPPAPVGAVALQDVEKAPPASVGAAALQESMVKRPGAVSWPSDLVGVSVLVCAVAACAFVSTHRFQRRWGRASKRES